MLQSFLSKLFKKEIGWRYSRTVAMGKAGKKYLFCSGLSSGPNFRFGTGSRGIEISRDSPGRDKKGYFKHGTVQDGIEPSRDWTGQFGRDWDTTGLHGTALIYYGIARDGMQKRFYTVFCTVHSKHSQCFLWYDCTFCTVLYANVTACHGMDELYPFIEWGAEKNKHTCVQRSSSSGVFVTFPSCCSNYCVTPHKKNEYTSPSRQ